MECEENGKKHNKKTPHFIALSMVKIKIDTSRESNVDKKRGKDKNNPKYGGKY